MQTTNAEREEIISEHERKLAEQWQKEDSLTKIGVLMGVPIVWAVIIVIILSIIMSIGHTIENLDRITERWELGQYIFVLFVAVIIFFCGVVAGGRMRESDYEINSWF
jgi:hypothetical protein